MGALHRSVRITVAWAIVVAALALPAGTVATHSAEALLPDLVMLQPSEFRIERTGGQRLLRFSTVIANAGDGPFDVYGYHRDGGAITPSSRLHVRQRLLEGTDTSGNRVWSGHDAVGDDGAPSTMFYSGDGHNHWHVEGLQEWSLAFEATPDDVITGGAKTGFCFWDNADLGLETPREYFGSQECHVRGDQVPMGLAVGWGDKYPWSIAGQFIDITSLPYGRYCLTLAADPRGEFVESDTANNTARTLISIRKSGVTVVAPECGEGTDPEPPAEGDVVVHVADLDGAFALKGKSGRWEALVTVTIVDSTGAPVNGAVVTGQWSDAASGTVSGTTSGGTVTLSSGNLSGGTSATLTITGISGSGITHDADADADPDPDSDGTTITVTMTSP